MTIAMPSLGRVRSTLVIILSNPVVDKSSLGLVDLDNEVIGASKPFVIQNILEPFRSTNNYLYALNGKLRQFT